MSLVVEHIHKSFGEVQAIKDLSMEVEEGALFGFLGPNGAGKMTTMRMILMVKHQDKVASAVQIPGILVVSGFALVYLGAFSPNTIWTEVLSYIPYLYFRVDARTDWPGRCRLVGDRRDDCINAGCNLRLRLVFRARLSPGSLNVRAAAWPATTAENGADKLKAETKERRFEYPGRQNPG